MLHEYLNSFLASIQVFSMNAKGFHWNVRGDMFFEMHQKYGELYELLDSSADAVAELIRSLNYTPLHTFQDYLNKSHICPCKDKSDPVSINVEIVQCLMSLCDQCSLIYEHEDCCDYPNIRNRIERLEGKFSKLRWMYQAYLGLQPNA